LSEYDRLAELAKKYGIVMAKSTKLNEKTTIYVLSEHEMGPETKSEFEKDFMRCFDPSKYSVLFMRDLHPSQLKHVLEECKTVYIGDKETCDAALAALLTLGHDFRYFVNEKMNILIKRRLEEIVPSFSA